MFHSTVLYRPDYFGFYIEDEGPANFWTSANSEEDLRQGFCAITHGVSIRVLSEFTKIPIEVEYDEMAIPQRSFDTWDHVVECAFTTRGNKIALNGASDSKPSR
jgi:hypothetical protein